MMETRVSYFDEQQALEGYLAAPNRAHDLPGVLVVPSWLNVNESICRRADRLAELGYVAFVADLFGARVRPSPPQSPMTVVGPFLDDRFRFRRRLVIYKAFVEDELDVPKLLVRRVHELYFSPCVEEFAPRTTWSLSNAFTSTFKELDPIPQFKATAKLGPFLEQALVSSN